MSRFVKAHPLRGIGSRGLKRVLLHAFVFFHLAAIVSWSFSTGASSAPLDKLVRSRFRHYVLPLGLWQGWDMFMRQPMSNVYLEAEVTLADGSRVTWPFPRMDQMNYFDRYRKERYRKWATERLWAGGRVDRRVAEAAAHFVARQVERPGNEARRVQLVRYRQQIPSPKRGQIRPYRQQPLLEAWERLVFYTWTPGGGGILTTQPATAPAAGGASAPRLTAPADEAPAAPIGGEP
jgi:hypothetical protein